MAAGKNLVPGSAQMLLLRLLAERDMYGYQMIEELAQRSNDTFALKAGTLYPFCMRWRRTAALKAMNSRAARPQQASRGATTVSPGPGVVRWRRSKRSGAGCPGRSTLCWKQWIFAQGWCCNGTDAKGMAADRHSPAALPAVRCRGWSGSWRIISANSITPLWPKAARRKKPSAGRWRAWETRCWQAARWTACTGPARPGGRFLWWRRCCWRVRCCVFSGACPFRHKARTCGARARTKAWAAALAGIAVLAAVYFCMDVSLLARWTKALYIGLAAVSAYGFLAGYTLMNGRRLWTVWGVSYDATHFSMIFIPIYAAVVYRAAWPRLGGAAGQRFCHCAGALAVYHGAASGRGVCAGACGACRVSGMLRSDW